MLAVGDLLGCWHSIGTTAPRMSKYISPSRSAVSMLMGVAPYVAGLTWNTVKFAHLCVACSVGAGCDSVGHTALASTVMAATTCFRVVYAIAPFVKIRLLPDHSLGATAVVRRTLRVRIDGSSSQTAAGTVESCVRTMNERRRISFLKFLRKSLPQEHRKPRRGPQRATSQRAAPYGDSGRGR